jgi:hypothetical protein
MTLEPLDFQRSSEGHRTAEDEMQCRREVRILEIEQGGKHTERQVDGTIFRISIQLSMVH